MINAILEAISIALDAEFGYENHIEEIKQDLAEPCFFISCLNPTTNLFLGKRYFKKNQFCIQYFPETDHKQRECHKVAEKMLWCLEYITVMEDLVNGTNMNYEIVDGVLQFFVNYDCFIYKKINETPIGEIDSSQTVKG